MTRPVYGDRSLGQRDNQEDAFGIVLQSEQDPKTDILLTVADGMGGHVGGEIASHLAIKVFERHFVSGSEVPRPGARLKDALVAANEAIRSRILEDPSLKGMGCTLIGALKLGDQLIWVSVGDSLLYLFRDGRLSRLNADHSLMAELLEAVEAGKMTLAEARSHPRRNALRSAVIGEPLKLVDSNSVSLRAGDLIVIATDGLDTLGEEVLQETLLRNQKGSVEAITDALLQQVERSGKANQDNTTVVTYRHGVGGMSGLYKDSKWKLPVGGRHARGPARPLLLGVGVGLAIAAVALVAFLDLRPDPAVDIGRPDGAEDGTRPSSQDIIEGDGMDGDTLTPAEPSPRGDAIPGDDQVGDEDATPGDDPIEDEGVGEGSTEDETDPLPQAPVIPGFPQNDMVPEGGDGGITEGQPDQSPDDDFTVPATPPPRRPDTPPSSEITE